MSIIFVKLAFNRFLTFFALVDKKNKTFEKKKLWLLFPIQSQRYSDLLYGQVKLIKTCLDHVNRDALCRRKHFF